jgi:hypothetical protein
MSDRIEELFQQVMDENCKDPLRRFAELVAADEREANKREWVSLTDEEVHEAAIKCVKSGQSVNAVIRAIEAKLKEKNT